MSSLMSKALFFSLIKEHKINVLEELNGDWFNKEVQDKDILSEKSLFEYIKNHYDNYQVLPDFVVLKNSGIDLENDVLELQSLQPLKYYVDYFSDRFLKNKFNEASRELSKLSRNTTENSLEAYQHQLELLLEDVKSQKKDTELSTLAQEIETFYDEYDKNKYKNKIAGVPTGFVGLDDVTDGIKPGDIFVLAARPNIGKTYLLLKMAIEAWKAGKTVLVVSLEMEIKQIVNRIIAMYAKLKPDLIAQNRLSHYGEKVLCQKGSELLEANNFYLLEGNLKKSVTDILDITKNINPDVIFIDGVYLLDASSSSKKRYSSTWEKVSDVLESIKGVAMETGKGFVVTTQFNRQVKKKTTSELDLSNIAGSDSIGQLASVVMGVKMGVPPYSDQRRIIEVIKNRNGPLVKFETHYDFNSMNFDYIGIYTQEDSLNKLKNKADKGEKADVDFMY